MQLKPDKYIQRIYDTLLANKKPILALAGAEKLPSSQIAVPEHPIAQSFTDPNAKHEFYVANFLQNLISKIAQEGQAKFPRLAQVIQPWIKDGAILKSFLSAKNRDDLLAIEKELGWQSHHKPNWGKIRSIINANKSIYPELLKEVILAYASYIHSVSINNEDRYSGNFKQEIEDLGLSSQGLVYNPEKLNGRHDNFAITVQLALYALDQKDSITLLKLVYEDANGKFSAGTLEAIFPGKHIPPSPVDGLSPFRLASFAKVLAASAYKPTYSEKRKLEGVTEFHQARDVFADSNLLEKETALEAP